MSNDDIQTPDDNESPASRRMALAAVLLLLLGATMLTVGISLAYGVPNGLIALGIVLLAGGLLLGLAS